MTTNFEATADVIRKRRKEVDGGIRMLNAEMEHENTLLPQSVTGVVRRVIKVYRGVRPLFTVLSTLPILPSSWRTGIVIFTQVLDTLAEIDINAELAAGKDAEFKAGKDL